MPETRSRRASYECDRAIGLDLGASTIHGVALSLEMNVDGKREVLAADLFDLATDEEALLDFCQSPHIAIDAPDRLSQGLHVGDERMGQKFQTGRCAEGALGRKHGMWVPWTTPMIGEPVPTWMASGFELWRLLREIEEPIEVYPHAIFLRLAGHALPKKQIAAGRKVRLEILATHVDLPAYCVAWSHDSIDALAAALVAWHRWTGTAERVYCGEEDPWPNHDSSAIWLPPRPATSDVRSKF